MGPSAKKYKPRSRKPDATGRSAAGAPFVKLDHYKMRSDAWRSLSATSRALYAELRLRYNGRNNGQISMSVREAARELHIAKDTATKCFEELASKGFIRVAQKGSFHWKVGRATTWILTSEEFNGDYATKDFMRWQPEKNNGPKSGTNGPKIGTVAEPDIVSNSFAVPNGAHFSEGEQ